MKQLVNVLVTIVLCVGMSVSGMAHSGRTDGNGGHKDNKNVSGLGSYHYHHGYPAHLHPNGVCPYENNGENGSVTTNTTSKSEVNTSAKKEEPKEYCVYTDISVNIDGNAIQSYNYKDDTYVDCNHLNNYGFDVSFDSVNKTIIIKRNSLKEVKPMEVTRYPKGKAAYEIKKTDIKVYKNVESSDSKMTAFNGNGNMYVKFSELSDFGESSWDSVNRVAGLKLK